ncbi:uncharacterized protein LOC107006108 [Solanum pennellii]|uniref:Uncharacterized protein LOC107006108 n=1 Tax=Solanum pennellii TaxID=28526 RepID=A0ABM1FQJ8_SOLPN|nr:uncharacterized protein LOC107006108 [Solanum pennellii]
MVSFAWKDATHAAFDSLKNKLSAAPFLALPDFSQEFQLETNASGLLRLIPNPSIVFEDIAMDFITCFPSCKDKSTIMTVVDRLSKYGHFIALSSSFTTQSVAETFVIGIVRFHGPPSPVQQIIPLNLDDTAYIIPETSMSLEDKVSVWDRSIVVSPQDDLEDTSVATVEKHIQMTPFRVLHGRDTPSVARYILGSSEMIEAYLVDKDESLSLLKAEFARAQNWMKVFADKSRRELT